MPEVKGFAAANELDKGHKYLFIKLKVRHNRALERRLRLSFEGGIRGKWTFEKRAHVHISPAGSKSHREIGIILQSKEGIFYGLNAKFFPLKS